ncbi:MAG: LolA family protein [Thermodesulfobacteriota bacterium]
MFLLVISLGMVLYHFHLPMGFGFTGQEVLKEIQKRYEATNDFEANFIQESLGKMMKGYPKAEGKVYFKKKGMMRWDYKTPNQKLISNGVTLWYYQPEENQVLIYNVAKVIRERIPLAFLSGEGSLSRDFNLTNFNESMVQGEDHFILEMVPKEPFPALAKLILRVDKKTYMVIQSDVFDELGNVTRTRFIDIKTNLSLSNSLFNFTIPPGTEVLQLKDPPGSSSVGKGTK